METERALPAWTDSLGADHALGRVVRLGLGVLVMAAILLSEIPLCPTARTLHMPCPGCGLTRATLAMLQGHFAEAWAYHPLSFLISPLVVGSGIYFAVRYVRVGALWERRHPGWIIGALLALQVALVALWIARFFGAFGGPVAI